MRTKSRPWRRAFAAGGFFTLLGVALAWVTLGARDSEAGLFHPWHRRQRCGNWEGGGPGCVVGDLELTGEPGGTWYWTRSPEEERRVIIGLYNRYCIRCHGVDGGGVWDIPDVPDFTSARWQACRSDAQLVRAILEGRGAVMPPFRGTMTLEEAWGMARYLRTFVPGTEASRPDTKQPEKPGAKEAEKPGPKPPAPKKPEQLPK
jgi:hypothetical protein